MKSSNRHTTLITGELILAFLLTAGCSQTFEPHQENDRYFFSMYGYLDASADTNWVRITPVRDVLVFGTGPVDASVTIENTAAGNPVALNDSVFAYALDARVHNFWTTAELEPAQTYRLEAAHPDGRTSRVSVVLPEDFPTPVISMPEQPEEEGRAPEPDEIFIAGVEHLADVQMLYLVRHVNSGRELIFSYPYLQNLAASTQIGTHRIEIDPENNVENPEEIANEILSRFGDENGNEQFVILRHQVYVAAAGPGWPDFESVDEIVQALPEAVSNVENGVGYVAGIVSKTVPYKSCLDERDNPAPCPVEKPLVFP